MGIIKKIILLALVISFGGCDLSANYDEAVFISINPKKTMEDVFAELDESTLVYGFGITEGQMRSGFVAIVPTFDVNDALAQYKQAYQENHEILKSLLGAASSGMKDEFDAAIDRELQELSELARKPKRIDTVYLTKICVSGPKNKINAFGNKMGNIFKLQNFQKCT